MNTPTKITAFFLGLGVAFAGAAGLGHAVGPSGAAEPAAPEHGDSHASPETGPATDARSTLPAGLAVTQSGYTLALSDRIVAADDDATLSFSILDDAGRPVTDYETTHGKPLHLIAVRRDLTGFQHVHPTLDARGRWSVSLDLSRAGEWRVFADFAPAGHEEALTLGADLAVAGRFAPERLPEPQDTARVDDYDVSVDGRLVPGETSRLTLTVRKDARPVRDLQPYLEAYGHLVALRDGDLAYLHVHPDGEPGDGRTEAGPDITFYVTTPSAGSYRLFLDFRHAGRVRTASFTQHAGYAGPAGSDSGRGGDAAVHGEGGHGH